MGGEMDDDVVVSNAQNVAPVEDIELRAARKIVGIKKAAHVNAEIAAAAGD